MLVIFHQVNESKRQAHHIEKPLLGRLKVVPWQHTVINIIVLYSETNLVLIVYYKGVADVKSQGVGAHSQNFYLELISTSIQVQ